MTEEKKEEENFDYDFSIYEDDEDDFFMETKSVFEKEENKGAYNLLVSKFSNGEEILKKLAEIEKLITKYGISVSSRTKDRVVLWKFYGVLEEYWDNIYDVYGSAEIKDIAMIKKRCIELLEKHHTGRIPPSLYNNLIYLKKKIYSLAGRKRFRYEVEKRGTYGIQKTKRKIVEG